MKHEEVALKKEIKSKPPIRDLGRKPSLSEEDYFKRKDQEAIEKLRAKFAQSKKV